MGHAGAFTAAGEPDAKAKIAALSDAGVAMVNHPSKIGQVVRSLLSHMVPGSSAPDLRAANAIKLDFSQRRQLCYAAGKLRAKTQLSAALPCQQRRQIYLAEDRCMDLFRQVTGKVNCGSCSGQGTRRLLGLGIDRSIRSPCIIAAPSVEDQAASNVKRHPFDFRRGPGGLAIERVAAHLQLSNTESHRGVAVDDHHEPSLHILHK